MRDDPAPSNVVELHPMARAPRPAAPRGTIASEMLLIGSLCALYAFLQFTISPDWPAWILAPAVVLAYRIAMRNAERRGTRRDWLRNAAAFIVPFAALYTPLQWAMSPDWQAWVIAPLLVALGWGALGLMVYLFEEG
ncbi:hypothetical protein PQ455_10050 [Sphingomonas naphthae]|uniref:Uncharacterized protein n=1 Tax=Sphingomonas naphthae TaxID=1813468 RepID=A0ABY7TG95_9SPHN|nr:hypothetical protein [Sphingomonas naphthae]WCT71991.1 hypothetical protein PQ455_10050 [Sphingomonas naphthae]